MKLLSIFLLSLFSPCLLSAEVNTLTIFGELHSKPCSIKPGGDVIDLELETVTDSLLFTPGGRTKINIFPIQLEKCNPNVAKTLSVTINGTPSSYDSTFLGLASSSTAQGLGIKFTDKQGHEVNLSGVQKFPIKEGDMSVELGAYMKMLSKADFKIGMYKATANLVLAYQ